MSKCKKRKYQTGGGLDPISIAIAMMQQGSTTINAANTNSDGTVKSPTMAGIAKGVNPIGQFTSATEAFSDGKIGKGILMASPLGKIAGGIDAFNNSKKENERIRKEQRDLQIRNDEAYARGIMNTYPTSGVRSRVFANGGQLPDENSMPLSNEAEMVVANPAGHNSPNGDVPVEYNGEVKGEVENGEVVKGNQVFSQRDGYADVVKPIEAAKGMIQKIVASINKEPDKFKRGTLQRTLGFDLAKVVPLLNSATDATFATQESNKVPTNKTQFAKGEDLLKSAVPYLDNVTNQIILNNTPKVAKPDLVQTTPLKTTFNIQPQLNEITDATTQANTAIDRTTKSVNSANALKTAGILSRLKAKNALYSEKENKETELTNADRVNAQQVERDNTALLNKYKDDVAARDNYIRTGTMQNMANITSKIQTKMKDDAANELELNKMKVNATAYADKGFDENLALTTTIYDKEPLLSRQAIYEKAMRDGRTSVGKALATKWTDIKPIGTEQQSPIKQTDPTVNSKIVIPSTVDIPVYDASGLPNFTPIIPNALRSDINTGKWSTTNEIPVNNEQQSESINDILLPKSIRDWKSVKLRNDDNFDIKTKSAIERKKLLDRLNRARLLQQFEQSA